MPDLLTYTSTYDRRLRLSLLGKRVSGRAVRGATNGLANGRRRNRQCALSTTDTDQQAQRGPPRGSLDSRAPKQYTHTAGHGGRQALHQRSDRYLRFESAHGRNDLDILASELDTRARRRRSGRGARLLR